MPLNKTGNTILRILTTPITSYKITKPVCKLPLDSTFSICMLIFFLVEERLSQFSFLFFSFIFILSFHPYFFFLLSLMFLYCKTQSRLAWVIWPHLILLSSHITYSKYIYWLFNWSTELAILVNQVYISKILFRSI